MNQSPDSTLIVFIIIGFFLGLVFYFTPTIIAVKRKRNALAIFVLNLLGGWTAIGWVAALVWSLSSPQQIVIINNTNGSGNNIPQ